MFHVTRLSAERTSAVLREISDDAVPSGSFYLFVVLSTAIASYGLLANSTAVVIGAMLIAPLMGPIYGIALGLLRNDRRLLVHATASEAIGIVLAVGLAVVIGVLPLRPDFGSEILVRTKPNLYDLLVAIVAGVAGAYARTSERLSPTLPGVAIATALVPPLAVCGLCLSDGRWDAALGAFLLFATNLLAIEIAAGAVFIMAGLTAATGERHTAAMLLRRFVVPIALLIPISVFLLQTLVAIVRDDRLSRTLRTVLADDLRSVLGAEVSDVQHSARDNELQVVAVVLTPQSIDRTLVAATEDDLRRRVDRRTRLVVRSLLSRDDDRNGQVFVSESARQQLRFEREQQSFLGALSSALRKGLEDVTGAELVDVQREARGSFRVKATVRAPVTIDPPRVAAMQRAAAAATREPIQLVVRSVSTREANDHAFLDENAQSGLIQRAHDAIEALLRQRAPDADLLSLRQNADSGTLTATVVGIRHLDRKSFGELTKGVNAALGQDVRLVLRLVRTDSMGSQ